MKLIDQPEWNDVWQGETMAVEDDVHWICLPMIFNQRLIGVLDDGNTFGATWGWCYGSREAVREAVQGWDPQTQDEPMGWHKRASGPVRMAPRREEDVEYNRARCAHGSYLHSGTCERTVVCDDFRRRRSGF